MFRLAVVEFFVRIVVFLLEWLLWWPLLIIYVTRGLVTREDDIWTIMIIGGFVSLIPLLPPPAPHNVLFAGGVYAALGLVATIWRMKYGAPQRE